MNIKTGLLPELRNVQLVGLLKRYSNTPTTLLDLQEAQRQLVNATQNVTQSRQSVQNVAAPKRERKPWVKPVALTERFTAEELEQIVQEARSRTMTYAAVAEKYGISLSSVERLVKRSSS